MVSAPGSARRAQGGGERIQGGGPRTAGPFSFRVRRDTSGRRTSRLGHSSASPSPTRGPPSPAGSGTPGWPRLAPRHPRRRSPSAWWATIPGRTRAVSIDDCIADVRRAVEHFRNLAAGRELDPARLASGGSSAGGHLALAAAMIAPERPVPAADPRVAAVVALNPVVDLLAYSPAQQQSLEREVARIPREG